MADKTTGELRAVRDAAIGDLPQIVDIYDDTKIPVEQQGEARHMTGAQWVGYAKSSVSEYVGGAKDAATRSESAAKTAQEAADNAADAVKEAKSDLQSYLDGAEAAEASAAGSANTALESAQEAKESIEKFPSIGSNGHWYVWDIDNGYYVDSGIPAQGNTGPQGVQGPEGPRGINGVAVAADGQYAFNVDENGHLILSYTGTETPNFTINQDGHLIMGIE